MWTKENRARYDRSKLRYPSDLTDAEWGFVGPLIPPARRGGGKRTVNIREVINGLMYVLSTGCQWRAIPKDFPPKSTVYGYFEPPRVCRRPQLLREWAYGSETSNRFSPEVRERAVRMVLEHQGDHASQWAAIASIAGKIGCTGETLRGWVRQAERDVGSRAGVTSDERARLKALERENRELRQANEILRKASAYFAQAELDRRSKP
jgi:transposase-like protein